MDNQTDYSVPADRFRPVAQRFCSLVDSAASLDRNEFLLQIYHILPELIGEAMRLPRVEHGDDEDEVPNVETPMSPIQPEDRIGHEVGSQLYNALKEKFGDWDLYWEVFDPTKDNEAICGSLADDIADIYRDLKGGLDHFEVDKSLSRESVFEWRSGFYSHWGRHAIRSLHTLHCLLNDILD